MPDRAVLFFVGIAKTHKSSLEEGSLAKNLLAAAREAIRPALRGDGL
jgi:hypothetical protein